MLDIQLMSKKDKSDDDFITATEAAKLKHCHPVTLRKYAQEGKKVRAIKLGKTWVYHLKDIRKLEIPSPGRPRSKKKNT